jgi:hypothetical protein
MVIMNASSNHLAAAAVVSPAVRIKSNAVAYGSALIAERDYQAGEVIARFNDAKPAKQSYLTVQVGPGRHVELETLGNLNHSCRPNTVIDTASRTVTACRAIKAGEMLTFFYPSTEWHMDRPFVCQCGETECLRFVAGARYLTADILSRYYINAHIVEAIVATLTCGKVAS